MTLKQAIQKAYERGGWIAYGTPPDWSEYSTQHRWCDDGLHMIWTAGCTVGGEFDPVKEAYRFGSNLDREGFNVHAGWLDITPID